MKNIGCTTSRRTLSVKMWSYCCLLLCMLKRVHIRIFDTQNWFFAAVTLLLTSSFGLSGCATAPQTQDPAALSNTHGYVYVSVLKFHPHIGVTSLSDGQHYDILPNCNGCQAHGIWLPEGDYVMSGWDLSHWPRDTPPFTVKRRQVTSLGGFVPLELGGYDFAVMPMQTTEIREETALAIRDLRAYLDPSKPIIEWTTSDMPPIFRMTLSSTGLGLIPDLLMEYERHVNKPPVLAQIRAAKTKDELLNGAKAITPPTTLGYAQLPDGSLLYGAELGQIKVRKPNKDWGSLDTGTLHTVTAVTTRRTTPEILTGSDDGVIRRGAVEGGWIALKRLPRREKIVALLAGANEQKFVVSAEEVTARGIITTTSTKAVTVYTAKQDDFSDLEELRHFELSMPNFWTTHAEMTSNSLYLNVLPDLWRFRSDAKTWEKVNPPTDVTRFSLSGDGRTLIAYKLQGAFSKLYLSKDTGASWIQKDAPPYTIVDIFFSDETRGVATRWSAGAFSGNYEFMRYDAAGDRWVKTEELPDACKRIIWTADLNEKLCISNGQSILRKEPTGWRVEYAVE